MNWWLVRVSELDIKGASTKSLVSPRKNKLWLIALCQIWWENHQYIPKFIDVGNLYWMCVTFKAARHEKPSCHYDQYIQMSAGLPWKTIFTQHGVLPPKTELCDEGDSGHALRGQTSPCFRNGKIWHLVLQRFEGPLKRLSVKARVWSMRVH